jgi:hypothetical protein
MMDMKIILEVYININGLYGIANFYNISNVKILIIVYM